MYQQGEEAKPTRVHLGEWQRDVEVLKRRGELDVVVVLVEVNHIGHRGIIVACKVVLHLLEAHIARLHNLVAVGNALVVGTENEIEVFPYL